MLVARIRAAVQVADLATADAQAANWSAPGDDGLLIAYLSSATNHLARAANTLDHVGRGSPPDRIRAVLVSSAGAVMVTVAAAIWTPAPAVGYTVGAGLASWWILFSHIQYGRRRRALATAQAHPDVDPHDPLEPIATLVKEISGVIADIQPMESQQRLQAAADLRTAAGWIATAMNARRPKHDTSGSYQPQSPPDQTPA
jgi:hypothetical protein